MAITFDNLVEITYQENGGIYRKSGGGVDVSANLQYDSSIAYFMEPVQVNDAIYFGYTNIRSCWTGGGMWHNLQVYVGTPRTNTGAGVWEYSTGSNGNTRLALTVTDPSNGFTVAGQHTILFDPPADWTRSNVFNGLKFYVRYRITSIGAGIAEGGHNSTQRVKVNDYTIRVTATSEDRLSSNLIQEDTTYYWRVRAKSGIITGVWSDVRSFKVKAAQSAPVPAGSIFDTFGIVSVYPPDGASNLADWPTQVRVTFTAPPSLDSVAANVAVTANNIDTGAVQTAPTLTPSVSGNTLTLLLSGEISANTRYTVSILDVLSSTGVQLSNPTSFSFTGPYTPLYSTASALRTAYGRFLLRYKDDEINYQIHRASIKCNRILDDAGSLPIANLLVAKDAITFDMVSYVEAFSAYCLIQSYLYEMLEQAGRTNQIDTLRASTEARLIADIDKVLKELEIETKRLEMALKGGAPSPVVGVRSSGWDPSTQYDDQSTTYLVRGKF